MGRIQLVLEDELFAEIERRAKKSGASRSLVLRDLVRLALEIEEDFVFSDVAESRKATYKKARAFSHDAVMKKLG